MNNCRVEQADRPPSTMRAPTRPTHGGRRQGELGALRANPLYTVIVVPYCPGIALSKLRVYGCWGLRYSSSESASSTTLP